MCRDEILDSCKVSAAQDLDERYFALSLCSHAVSLEKRLVSESVED